MGKFYYLYGWVSWLNQKRQGQGNLDFGRLSLSCVNFIHVCSLGEGCSHVAAILFKVEFAVRNGYTSVTSQECFWNQYTKIVS